MVVAVMLISGGYGVGSKLMLDVWLYDVWVRLSGHIGDGTHDAASLAAVQDNGVLPAAFACG